MLSDLYRFLSMQGYGAYVWPCYIVLICLCILHVYLAVRDSRRVRDKLARRIKANMAPDA